MCHKNGAQSHGRPCMLTSRKENTRRAKSLESSCLYFKLSSVVEGQRDVDFWISDYLEMSVLAGKQRLGFGMEKHYRNASPWGLCTARYQGPSEHAC